MDERQARREARLDAELAARGELEPPWARYPWIGRGSIGWRMGVGESYLMMWEDFRRRRFADADALIAYLKVHPPAPRSWIDPIGAWIARNDDDDDDPDKPALRARIVAAGLVADDAAYPVFVRNALRDGGVTAPWTWRVAADGPEPALRYCARELGWWARWLAGADRAAWLDAQPAPPEPWAAVAAAIRAGDPGAVWARLDGGAAGLVPAMVMHGALPPPWLGGHAPKAAIDFNDAPDDRDRWAWWVFDTFEDAASWRAYLERWPPPPPWRHALDVELFEWLVGD